MPPFKIKGTDQWGKTISHYVEGEFHGDGRVWVCWERVMWVVEPKIALPTLIEGLAKKTIKPYYKRYMRQVRRRSKFSGTPHPRKPVWYYVDDPLGRMISVNEG